jgi:acyl-homoserine lactone acylase PvdQ
VIGLAALALSTFPRESGTVRLSGLAAPVTIETDANGVPTIRASSEAEVLFGLGYVHARDRLWQIEYQRRIGAGRLAEILGPRLVETDRFLRTIGFRRAAESAWRSLPAEQQLLLEAYTRGLNAYVASSSVRPIEFRILRCPASRFEPVDSLAWAKLMAWDLAGNARNEIRRARFVEAVGEKRASELLPSVPETPTILEDSEWQPPVRLPSVSRLTSHVSRQGLGKLVVVRVGEVFRREASLERAAIGHDQVIDVPGHDDVGRKLRGVAEDLGDQDATLPVERRVLPVVVDALEELALHAVDGGR